MTKEEMKLFAWSVVHRGIIQRKHLDPYYIQAAKNEKIPVRRLEKIAWSTNSSEWAMVHALAALLRSGTPNTHVQPGELDYEF